MSTFEKIISIIFSVIILIISITLMLTIGGILSPYFGTNIMEVIMNEAFFSRLLFIIALVLMILSLRELIFGEKLSTDGKEGLILENESGRLIISKESLENLVAGAGREIDGIDGITSRTFIDNEKNVIVDVNIIVNKDSSLKDISSELQKKIKLALKQTADLDVKYVNIKVKNVANKKTKKSNLQDGNTENKQKVKEKNS